MKGWHGKGVCEQCGRFRKLEEVPDHGFSRRLCRSCANAQAAYDALVAAGDLVALNDDLELNM